MAGKSSCDSCMNYVYDEESEEYWCMVNLDEDDMSRMVQNRRFECPYYQLYDEYKIVRKQM